MFGRARLVLAAWYAGALILTVAGLGVVTYALLRDDLQNEIDASLRNATGQLLALESLGTPTAQPTTAPLTSSPTGGDSSSDDHGGNSGKTSTDAGEDGDSDDSRRLQLLTSESFYLRFDRTGVVLSNPRQVDLQGVDLVGVSRKHDAPFDVRGDSEHYRMLVTALDDGTFLAVGRGLETKDHQLRTLTTVFMAGGVIALAASLGTGFWLAGRTLRPIRESLESQRRFVSDASHELRTPLAVAKANTSLLLEDTEATVESKLDEAEAVASELDHLSVLVADLTTLARADEGRANLLLEPMDLGELAREVVRDMGALADVRGVRLDCDISAARMNGDRARLRQLLIILVDNALKYAPAEGLVRLVCGVAHGHVEVTVGDNGAGISEQDQKHIFERFYRAESERARGKGGTGLGLAIGKWIAEAHGGRITVESQPGHGTTFRVRLPEE
jgi:signal transduction histidine kinase